MKDSGACGVTTDSTGGVRGQGGRGGMICLIEGLARVQATGCLSLLRVGVRYALCAGCAFSDAFAEFRDAY